MNAIEIYLDQVSTGSPVNSEILLKNAMNTMADLMDPSVSDTDIKNTHESLISIVQDLSKRWPSQDRAPYDPIDITDSHQASYLQGMLAMMSKYLEVNYIADMDADTVPTWNPKSINTIVLKAVGELGEAPLHKISKHTGILGIAILPVLTDLITFGFVGILPKKQRPRIYTVLPVGEQILKDHVMENAS